MSAFSVIFSSPIVGLGFRAVAFLACFSCAAALVSAEEKERPYLSDEVGEQLGKVRPLFDEKKWDEALVIIDKVYAKAKPGSYDQAVLLNTKLEPIGTRIFCPVTRELRTERFMKIVSLAPEVL